MTIGWPLRSQTRGKHLHAVGPQPDAEHSWQCSVCADEGLQGDAKAGPQQKVGIWKLDGDLSRLRCRVERVGAGDETALVRILVASDQNKPEFPPLGSLLQCFELFTFLVASLEIRGSRSLPNHVDGIELHDGGEPALVASLLGNVGAFSYECPTDDPGDWCIQFHLLQSNLAELDICTGFVDLGGSYVALRLGVQKLHLGRDIPGPQGLLVVQVGFREAQLRFRLLEMRLRECEGELGAP